MKKHGATRQIKTLAMNLLRCNICKMIHNANDMEIQTFNIANSIRKEVLKKICL